MQLSDDSLLTTKQLAAAYTGLGLPMAETTLETNRTRGGGPPYQKYGRNMVRYRWGDARDWRLAQGRKLTSTSQDTRRL